MILAGRYAEHRRWMIRSFSLIMAGVMLRVWVPLYYGLAGAGVVNFSFETAYAAIAWLCWVPNLLIARAAAGSACTRTAGERRGTRPGFPRTA